ncbi:hypothetical protein FA95DRAFT_1560703 [Auriscalpium vulgare]|uniref:Uncharacterized protein n=1 Tax=Auriscalpium vulgare TaxID=40419 RepID=A0ACB8RP04_9AGAM|nr:hypothetical protein FA95DRAFT_1560703 [Auriscalpium vulgare]
MPLATSTLRLLPHRTYAVHASLSLRIPGELRSISWTPTFHSICDHVKSSSSRQPACLLGISQRTGPRPVGLGSIFDMHFEK